MSRVVTLRHNDNSFCGKVSLQSDLIGWPLVLVFRNSAFVSAPGYGDEELYVAQPTEFIPFSAVSDYPKDG